MAAPTPKTITANSSGTGATSFTNLRPGHPYRIYVRGGTIDGGSLNLYQVLDTNESLTSADNIFIAKDTDGNPAGVADFSVLNADQTEFTIIPMNTAISIQVFSSEENETVDIFAIPIRH